MSEKFMVGQWVTWHERPYRVEQVDEAACEVRLNSGAVGAVSMWIPSYECFPFLWQVGKTYKTTLDGVTVRVDSLDEDGDILGTCSDARGYGFWNAKTGLILGLELEPHRPHLVPYLADEPPPVDDAATYSEFESDEADDVNHPPHYTQHPSGVECITITEAFNFNIGNAIKYLWRAGLKGDALEDLRKAAWYVQREIERRAKR